jgi:hypothetical protein
MPNYLRRGFKKSKSSIAIDNESYSSAVLEASYWKQKKLVLWFGCPPNTSSSARDTRVELL